MKTIVKKGFLILSLSCLSLSSCDPIKNKKKVNTQLSEDFNELLVENPSVSEALTNQVKDGGLYQEFKNPEELRSVDGKLETTLNVEMTTHTIYSFPEATLSGEPITMKHRSYNGKLCGPVLRIKRGDSLVVNMVNNLPNNTGVPIVPCSNNNCDSLVLNPTHEHTNEKDTTRYNVTNLHMHGFHVSPNDHSDNIFAEIYPSWHFQNRYLIPQNHAEGTFWYHAHVHGSTDIQVSSGMAGAVIIEGGLDTLDQIKAMDEKIFLLQQMSYAKDDTNAIKSINTDRENSVYHTMINGQTTPILRMQAQEVQRWRFVHAGVRAAIKLNLLSKSINEESGEEEIHQHLFYPIAEDGVAYGYRDEVYNMTLQPGYRADILVKADVEAHDTLYLIDESTEALGNISKDSIQEKNQLLAIIVVEEKTKEVATIVPSSEELAPYAPFKSLAGVTPTDPYVQACNFNIQLPDTTSTPAIPLEFQVNGYPFTTDSIILAQIGAVQDWELTSSFVDHPFHIHVNHFQILEIDGKKLERPKWKDTYMVEEGTVTKIRTIYEDFEGAFVIHCHILEHEDMGMMHTVAIVDDKQAYLKDKALWKQWSWCISTK